MVLIGIDPHKGSHTAVAIDRDETKLGELRAAFIEAAVRAAPRLGRRVPGTSVGDRVRRRPRLFGSDAAPTKVVDVGGLRLGLTFNLAQPDKKIVVEDERIVFPETPLADLLKRRFKQPVDLVAFAGTHRQLQQVHEGVLFFNPGSPTLPSDRRAENDLGSVAVLDVVKGKAAVDLVRLTAP